VVVWGFLMYRVELKGVFWNSSASLKEVPNVPCGVESKALRFSFR